VRYDIEAGGRVRRVTVERAGAAFAVTVDGRVHSVDAVRIDAHTLSLIVDSAVPAATQGPSTGAGVSQRAGLAVYEAVVAPESGTRRLVARVGGVPVTVAMASRSARTSGGSGGGAALRTGPSRLVAPMPGKVVRVLVQVGDRVHARQPMVVIEAMKMENELRASRAGTVAELAVREGQSVEAGALLLVIVPA